MSSIQPCGVSNGGDIYDEVNGEVYNYDDIYYYNYCYYTTSPVDRACFDLGHVNPDKQDTNLVPCSSRYIFYMVFYGCQIFLRKYSLLLCDVLTVCVLKPMCLSFPVHVLLSVGSFLMMSPTRMIQLRRSSSWSWTGLRSERRSLLHPSSPARTPTLPLSR